jgi:NADPH-dependent 2,4-dienoyl-CoA reductase/sulfur reductase-like enzyme
VRDEAVRGSYDVAVIGAGPAGLAAAASCARAGLATVLFDEQQSPGGQIYRAITETPLKRESLLGQDYWHGAKLVAEFETSGAQYVSGATVWSLTRELEIGVSVEGHSQVASARRVILATGALERPFPIPGWTLPGVMTAGAAQILLKSAGVAPCGRTVLAGCGPLLWLLAWQYLNAGVKLDAILDTTPSENRLHALPHLVSFLASPYFLKGLALMLAVRGKVPIISHVTQLRAEGAGRVGQVSYQRRNGAAGRMPVDTLLLHQGVVPNVNLAMSVGV